MDAVSIAVQPKDFLGIRYAPAYQHGVQVTVAIEVDPNGRIVNSEAVPKVVGAGSAGMQTSTGLVADLPPDFRAALMLRVNEELSFRDVAKVLKTTEETARWRVFKARQKLLQVLSPELLPPGAGAE